MKNLIFALLIFSFLFSSCKGDDYNCCAIAYETNCNKIVTIDAMLYSQVNTSNYVISSVILTDNCLSVKVYSSGCNTENWDMNLILSPSIVETSPSMYYSKIELINNEACLAVLEKELSFDLLPLQIQNQNQVQIKIQGWDSDIIYSY